MKIFDLQHEAIGNINRNFWNTVMIGAIVYGITLAFGILMSFIVVPLEFRLLPMMKVPPESMFSSGDGYFASYFKENYYMIKNNIVPFSILYGCSLLMNLLYVLFYAPIDAGAKLAYLSITYGSKAQGGTIFSTFRKYGRYVGAYFWRVLFIGLWWLLLIVPGIIKIMSYFAMPYLVAEYPHLKVRDAMKLSMRITKGYKHKIFYMYLLIFGWGLLYLPAAALTCGIGAIPYLFLWFVPLRGLFSAAMYHRLKMTAFEDGRLSAADLNIAQNGMIS